MATQSPDIAWLDASETISLTELSRACTFSAAELGELIGGGALVPLDGAADAALFSAHWVMPLRAAARLRRDFELDLVAVALLLQFLQRIDGLEGELRALRAALPGFARR